MVVSLNSRLESNKEENKEQHNTFEGRVHETQGQGLTLTVFMLYIRSTAVVIGVHGFQLGVRRPVVQRVLIYTEGGFGVGVHGFQLGVR